jgi:hypothetical protein
VEIKILRNAKRGRRKVAVGNRALATLPFLVDHKVAPCHPKKKKVALAILVGHNYYSYSTRRRKFHF